ncbi:matrixin family metalloprotease [Maribacter sp. 4G9]|uniref:matrixin family metalloprotease n=1 Tax=Maribacter sp. 4G9 TaxID=1889777 RepID=UPI000C15025A|nr:matrixin family metalloprotease [Maribacter sp. 4G9]PIB30757.1 hypothetical protein BFP75_01690 [Maribacter sp. 4G9]
MKIQIILFFAIAARFSASSQSVEFYSDHYNYDKQTLLMEGNFGEWTNSEFVDFINQSGGTVNIRAHIHHHLTFIYFVNSENNADHNISINIPSGGKYTLRVISKLSGGSPTVYNDQLGFDLTYQDGRTAYFELNASAYFHSNEELVASRPSGYEYWGLNGYTRSLDRSYLPLKVYSNHLQFGVNESWSPIINKGIDTWNNAASSIGITSGFFELASSHQEADMTIDWSGHGLSGTTLGMATLTQSNPSKVVGITMRPPGSDNALRTAEVLIQEMGHILGLSHSDDPADLMNGKAHPLHHADLSKIQLTTRDRQMLYWLYSQSNSIPIIPYHR